MTPYDIGFNTHKFVVGKKLRGNEFVYQGLEQNVVKIIYREYKRSLIQADNNQVLSYTLNENDEGIPVSFRRAKLIISKADNNEIIFKVIHGL